MWNRTFQSTLKNLTGEVWRIFSIFLGLSMSRRLLARPLQAAVARHGHAIASSSPTFRFVAMNGGFLPTAARPAATQGRPGGWEHGGGDRGGAGGSYQQGRLLPMSLAALGASFVIGQSAALCEDGAQELKDNSKTDASATASVGALVGSGTTLDLQAVTNWVKNMVDKVLNFLKGLYAEVLPKLDSLFSSLMSSTSGNVLPITGAQGEADEKKPDEEAKSDAEKDGGYQGATQ